MVNDDQPLEQAAAPASTAAAPGSPLDRVRRRYQQRRTELHLDLPVPGATWGGDLIARVRVLDERTTRAISERAGDEGLEQTADIVAASVAGLLVRAEDGALEPLLDEDGEPVAFDERFGDAIGVPACDSPRRAVFLAFSEGSPASVNVLALGSFVDRIGRWLADTSVEIEGAIVEGR